MFKCSHIRTRGKQCQCQEPSPPSNHGSCSRIIVRLWSALCSLFSFPSHGLRPRVVRWRGRALFAQCLMSHSRLSTLLRRNVTLVLSWHSCYQDQAPGQVQIQISTRKHWRSGGKLSSEDGDMSWTIFHCFKLPIMEWKLWFNLLVARCLFKIR